MDHPKHAACPAWLSSFALAAMIGMACLPASAHAGALPDLKLHATALIRQCSAAIPRARPARAHQVRNAVLGLRLSMSYRVAAQHLSPAELRSAAAEERACYDFLAETCRPLLS